LCKLVYKQTFGLVLKLVKFVEVLDIDTFSFLQNKVENSY